jgi:hypothetical protein
MIDRETSPRMLDHRFVWKERERAGKNGQRFLKRTRKDNSSPGLRLLRPFGKRGLLALNHCVGKLAKG